MVNQICSGLVQVLRASQSSLRREKKAKLDVNQVLDVIGRVPHKAGNSTTVADHGGRQVRLRLCRGLDAQRPGSGAGQTKRNQARLRATLVDQFYRRRAGHGRSRWDTSSLIKGNGKPLALPMHRG
jgi:hypothetical protein